MLHPLIALLEEHGLINPERVEKFSLEAPLRTLRSARERIELILKDEVEPVRSTPHLAAFDNYNFLASSSFRGDGACSAAECRFAKAQTLVRHTALYSDHLVLPLYVGDEGEEYFERQDMLGTLLVLELFRPLMERRVVTMVPSQLMFCKEHLHEAVPIFPRLLESATALQEKYRSEFSVEYEATEHGKGLYCVRGPEAFLEHRQIYFHTKHPRWLRRMRKGQKLTLSPEMIRSTNIVGRIFSRMTSDVAVHQYFGVHYGCKYLTDRQGEAELISACADDQVARATAALCSQLTHTIPLFGEVPLEEVLRIRKEEPEAFDNYRAALTRIVRNHIASGKGLDAKQARDLFDSELDPQLTKLRAQAATSKKVRVKAVATKIGATGAAVAIGLTGGFLPHELQAAVSALGGLKIAADLVEGVLASRGANEAVRSHDLYFLLRLSQVQ